MTNCPYCETEIIDELNFCIECERQVRCRRCGALLYKNKTRCLNCGEFLQDDSQSLERMNTYVLEEKATKSSSYRRIEVHASDNAVDAFTARPPFGNVTPLRPFNNDGTIHQESRLLASSAQRESTIIEQEDANPHHNPKQKTHEGPIEVSALFSQHSEHGLVPGKTLRDYIQKLFTKKEKQQIFALMYVWAFNEQPNESVSHGGLIAVMKYEGLYDTNTRKHLDELIKDYFTVNDDCYRVNEYDGKKRVSEVLEDIQNPKQMGISSEPPKAKKSGRPSGRISKVELEKVKPWLGRSLQEIEDFDARTLETSLNWGLFGIYILTKVLNVAEAVEAGITYVFLSQKYSTINVTRKTFVETLRKDKKQVSLSVNGTYSLSRTGEQRIKQLIEGTVNK